MKKVILLLAGSAMVAVPASAQARTRPGFSVGAELFDYSYREKLDGMTIVRDDGLFGGVEGSYVETIGGGLFLRGRLSVALGSVDYRSDEGSRVDNVSQGIGQLEMHLGYDLPLGGGATLTPFVGLGSRVLNDESGGEESGDGLLGYDREISYSYVPLGLAVGIPTRGATSLNLSAQYDWVVNGKARSDFSDVAAELPDIKLDLDEGHGFEASAMLAVPLGGNQLSVGPFVRTWRVGRSDVFVVVNPDDPTEGIELFEPRSETTELGLRIRFAF